MEQLSHRYSSDLAYDWHQVFNALDGGLSSCDANANFVDAIALVSDAFSIPSCAINLSEGISYNEIGRFKQMVEIGRRFTVVCSNLVLVLVTCTTRSFHQIRPITIDTKSTLLRVLQLNTLADGLFGLRDDCPQSRPSKKARSWEHRKVLLLDEIKRYEADAICLQEVDHYYDFFLPELRRLGYDGLYAPKPVSPCLEVSKNSDGCAIFIKRSKLRFMSSEVC